STVNDAPALATPLAVTTTLPVVAPAGTGPTTELQPHLAGVSTLPLNVTALVPWVEPKLPPAMVTDAPTAPELGDKLLMLGTASTGATIEVALQLAGVATVPLNVTALVPWVEPKFPLAMDTDAPTAPQHSFPTRRSSDLSTVNDAPALATPLTVTTTLPVVAP